MDKDITLHYLSLINYALGFATGAVAITEYKHNRNETPLLIILAIVIAGPLEDFLVRIIQNKPIPSHKKERGIQLVDQLTSIGFMLFLLLAALNSR